MHAAQTMTSDDSAALLCAIQVACATIAPTWPLDQFIAVNPYWGRIDLPFDVASGTLTRLTGSCLYMPMQFYREAWKVGEIKSEHLRQALAEAGMPVSEDTMIDDLERAEPVASTLPLLCDTLDAKRDLVHEPAWRDTISVQISQFCAAYFDRDQADWHPASRAGLYTNWLTSMRQDHSITLLMHAPAIRARARTSPKAASTSSRRKPRTAGPIPSRSSIWSSSAD